MSYGLSISEILEKGVELSTETDNEDGVCSEIKYLDKVKGLDKVCLHGLLSDSEIEKAVVDDGELIISPFTRKSPKGVISYGLSSYGYDLRVGNKYKVFTNAKCSIVDPKNFDSGAFVDVEGDYCLIPPNSFALAESVERLCLPRDILGICVGKSTYARCGIIVTITPLEPEWTGTLTIEISNTTPLPAKIYSNEGICQVLFFRSPYKLITSYADKEGKYQHQLGVTLPKVK